MALSWSGRRQLMYYGVVFVIALGAVYFIYETFFNNAPTCFDEIKNQDEHGVDCGGTFCALICPKEVRKPAVLWTRSFMSAPKTYTAAAYIQNNNPGAGAKKVSYTFQLFDEDNGLVVSKEGITDLPPIKTIPIVVPNINVGNRTVARTLFAFSVVPVWNKILATAVPSVRVLGQVLSDDASRLAAKLVNDSNMDLPRVTVIAVLFDGAGVARAASQSTLWVPARASQPLIFTWSGGVPNIVRAEITVLPPF